MGSISLDIQDGIERGQRLKSSDEASSSITSDHKCSSISSSTTSSSANSSPSKNSTVYATPNKHLINSINHQATPNSEGKTNRRFWKEELTKDAIYSIYLKKITYSNNEVSISRSEVSEKGKSSLPFSKNEHNKRLSMGKARKKGRDVIDALFNGDKERLLSGDYVTRSDQIDLIKDRRFKVKDDDTQQCLQWETRQVRILKAATLEHIVKYILLLNSRQKDQKLSGDQCTNEIAEEDRNNVSHVVHVLFSTYRNYSDPINLFLIMAEYSKQGSDRQFNFIVHFWLDNYPEDFAYVVKKIQNHSSDKMTISKNGPKYLNHSKLTKNRSEFLIDLLLSLPAIDETIYRFALATREEIRHGKFNFSPKNNNPSKQSSSCVLELDAKFVAQQLTAIDLENFINLRAYSLINGSKFDPIVQSSIKNFNLLSRHVIVTILKSQIPEMVANHWIDIAQVLRKMKNFNSLKAVIAGLTNESIYRLKNCVWSKLPRSSMNTFDKLSLIVDDVNNQIILRQTQLDIEGTAKVDLKEESFGTIPYLGTFLTDLTFIDNKFPSHRTGEDEMKLINMEKCAKQFEIITQVQLLQKNVMAALTAFHQSQTLNGLSQLPTSSSSPTIPRVARLFRNWFLNPTVSSMTDSACYQISLKLEPLPNRN